MNRDDIIRMAREALNNKDFDHFRFLQVATVLGWEDPGYTEPLETTVERARNWLASVREVTNDQL